MNTNQVRNYLLNDRTAMEKEGITLEYLKAATNNKEWHELLLSDKYDKILEALKVNPYERAHQAFRREYSHDIINKVDKINLKVTMLDGQTRNAIFFDNSFIKMQKWIDDLNARYNKRKRKFIKEYLSQFKKKQVNNYQLAMNKLGDFIKK